MDPSLGILRLAVVFVTAFNERNISQKGGVVNKELLCSCVEEMRCVDAEKLQKREEESRKMPCIGLP